MFVHAVFFWLKPGITPAEEKQFFDGVSSLLTIPDVVTGHVGKPAPTDRPVIDRSYSYGLLTVFKDLAGHDAYQVAPVHLKFIEECKHLWIRVQIYDFK